MLVEILKVDLGKGPTRVIAIQYSFDDFRMESKMRAAEALFDCSMPGMSDEMHRRIDHHLYRTAILELAQP